MKLSDTFQIFCMKNSSKDLATDLLTRSPYANEINEMKV